jgi:hypothetical protein
MSGIVGGGSGGIGGSGRIRRTAGDRCEGQATQPGTPQHLGSAVQQANVQIKLHNETGGSVVITGGQLAA